MHPGEIELGKTNVVAVQQNGNGEVIDINDGDDKMFKNENDDEKADKIDVDSKTGDSNMQEDDDDDDENKPLGYCSFIVRHHRLAFGKFIYSLLLCKVYA